MTGYSFTVTPDQALAAYRTADQAGPAPDGVAAGGGSGFADLLGQAVNAAIGQGHAAEASSAAVLSGSGNLTQAVSALAQAQLTLQTVTTLRDRMVSAYQDIMRMPI